MNGQCMGLRFRQNRRLVPAWVLMMAMLAGAGCDTDSFMDPSNVGRWENTPIVLPILDRLDVVEEPEDAIPGLSQITREDLIPEISEYVLGPGDQVVVTVFELVQPNVESVQVRQIDELGYIRLPVIGQVKAGGLTPKQLEARIVDILDPDYLRDPTVSVQVQEARQKTFNIIGAVGGVGTYNLIKSDFRLLDAIALARGMPADTQTIYVIRQVPLNDVIEHGTTPQTPRSSATESKTTQAAPEQGSDQAKPFNPTQLIEQLTDELDKQEKTGTKDSSTPPDNPAKPEQPSGSPPVTNTTFTDEGTADKAGKADVAAPLSQALDEQNQGGRWVNINGKWVQVEGGQGGTAEPTDQSSQLPPLEELVTQRVIEVDANALRKGDAKYNIIIRPNDIIRVPVQITGNFYIGGAIGRPGTYAIPGENKLTLKQAVIAAGGLSPIGIPERVDLIRRIDKNTEATVRLNLRAIFEGVQPDIYLKPDDTINVGTNLPATFLAVIRNGFRVSYGFGFLLDRNFDDKVYGYQRNF